MWFHKPHKNRNQYYPGANDSDLLKAFGPRGYWSWSKAYHDYYHRSKDGSYKWLNAANARAMAEALEYARLSKQLDSGGTVGGYRIAFSKAPGSRALINRRIAPGSGSPSFTNPRVSGEYEISYSPTLGSSTLPGIKLHYMDEPYDERDGYTMSFMSMGGGNSARPAGGSPISHVSLSKAKGVFAPSVDTCYRELNLSKVATDTRIISHIRVVVHDASSHAKSLKTTKNHWSIYLILKQSGGIRVNMTISEYDTEILEWTLLSHPLSLSKIRDWDFQVVPNITVGHFYKLIHEKHRQRYSVMGRGIDGDRFWIYTIISDLTKKRWLDNDQARDEIWDHLHHFYSLDGTTKWINMVAGKFY